MELAKQPLIRLVGIAKRFGSVQALQGATFEARAGEIHVVLGENGAGKSSMMSVLVGLYQPDQGHIEMDGRQVTIKTPADAVRLGISIVPQHVELIGNLSVWENVVLGREGSRFWLDRRKSRAAVVELARRHRLEIDPDARASSLSAGQQQKVEILKVLYRQARVVILDEPTTFLTPQETDSLFATLRHLSSEGITILLVTHKLRDALSISHRLTVMRSGRVVSTVPTTEADERQLVAWLMGSDEEASRRLMDVPPPPPLPDGAPVLLQMTGAHTTGGRNGINLKGMNLSLRAGEIHGIAGVTGNGQRELAEALLGLSRTSAGQILFGGKNVTDWAVDQRLQAGFALIPEDRMQDGILPSQPLFETMVLGIHRELFSRFTYHPRTATELAAKAISTYAVKAPDASVPISYLSGGNIQKVIVARAVHHCQNHPQSLLVTVNTTRGLDVRTVRQVRDALRDVAASGSAVLVMSEDLDELMEECHVISVIHHGELVARFERSEYDRYRIGEAMLGQTKKEVTA